MARGGARGGAGHADPTPADPWALPPHLAGSLRPLGVPEDANCEESRLAFGSERPELRTLLPGDLELGSGPGRVSASRPRPRSEARAHESPSAQSGIQALGLESPGSAEPAGRGAAAPGVPHSGPNPSLSQFLKLSIPLILQTTPRGLGLCSRPPPACRLQCPSHLRRNPERLARARRWGPEPGRRAGRPGTSSAWQSGTCSQEPGSHPAPGAQARVQSGEQPTAPRHVPNPRGGAGDLHIGPRGERPICVQSLAAGGAAAGRQPSRREWAEGCAVHGEDPRPPTAGLCAHRPGRMVGAAVLG